MDEDDEFDVVGVEDATEGAFVPSIQSGTKARQRRQLGGNANNNNNASNNNTSGAGSYGGNGGTVQVREYKIWVCMCGCVYGSGCGGYGNGCAVQ